MKRVPLVDRVRHVVDACRGKRVLHLGCTNQPYTAQSLADGSLLHSQLDAVAAELWGVDSDRQGLEELAGRGLENLVCGDLERLGQLDLPRDLDVIVAGEVIEHLSNPGRFLDGVRQLMSVDTRLLLTTINAYCGMRFVLYLLRGRSGRAEPVHPDHVAYYSYSTIHRLLARHELEVSHFCFYDLGPEHRRHNRFYLNWINDLCVALARQLSDGLIVECRIQ